ncbi:MAG: DUF4345 domain-containing protein [Nannocystales bacterium]
MNGSKILTIILLGSGILGTCVGAGLLLVPEMFHASSGIEIGGNVSLLSETRAPGGALLAIGALITAGAFVRHLRFTATVLATVVYLSYGLGRVLSMLVDGLPSSILVQAAILELVIGGVCLAALLRYRPGPTGHHSTAKG